MLLLLMHAHSCRMNDSLIEEQRKHDAATTQLRAEATAREAQLQEKTRLAADLAQQLDTAKAALSDEQKKSDTLKQLHQTSTQQLEALRQTHTVRAGVGGLAGSMQRCNGYSA